ncbi:SDR family NAD(P)-dependent oxidoreductase [Vibrio tubiashii]|uniref:3-oxoacyl-ACP reductase n=1 Tax=Vibrio tubiashii ATCC 19109 TaxID=1051646 RepID=F9T0G7_9VIBR|nr:SDR family oxidoreductase [Vibrio tubiashii]AIW12752.1 3-oxoacyl-ACP reductase [Vibrio tubiashii ATCC 19109]EGU58727.1 short-chain dehydrogenase/reductase SDR [Vibrio tubiashii ATCC 19109]EIF03100.1 short-chain dehydrogenase/reductase SDR [Vibrio tubiashii NCIMB 1337 = ATCC 19106]
MKNVIVTGSAKGLGLEISSQLAAEGYNVIGISRTVTKEYESLKAEYPETVHFYKFDFEKTEQIASLVKRVTKKHGRIYGLVNNAALGHDGVLATMHESDITVLLKVNIEAPILLTKYVSRSMLLNKDGRIVNVGSIIGSTGFNGLSVYGATKSALSGFTKSLARELGKAQITVNTLAPGYMETNMTGDLRGAKLEKIKRRSCLGRLANVSDASSMAVFLISDSASGITGSTFTVDAGSTA